MLQNTLQERNLTKQSGVEKLETILWSSEDLSIESSDLTDQKNPPKN